jgi:hypothetical protein
VAMVRRLAGFTGQYPWQWQSADGEAFICHLRSPGRGHPIVVSTARGYEGALALFMEYVTDPRYGWPAVCGERFGQGPQQIFHEGNTVVHASDFEGQPGRRPFTYEEVQALFDAADARVDEVRPCLAPGSHPAVWVTERRGRITVRTADTAFAAARAAAGLPAELDLHCLRHSYITHLVEFDYPERFVSEQAGHRYAATTAIYARGGVR